jgi:nicotinamide riboside transporter PnuC
MTHSLQLVIEWIGVLSGVAGSVLLAWNHKNSGYGFVLYTVSNICWIVFACVTETYSLLSMQLVYLATAGFGIYRWLYKPQQEKRVEETKDATPLANVAP